MGGTGRDGLCPIRPRSSRRPLCVLTYRLYRYTVPMLYPGTVVRRVLHLDDVRGLETFDWPSLQNCKMAVEQVRFSNKSTSSSSSFIHPAKDQPKHQPTIIDQASLQRRRIFVLLSSPLSLFVLPYRHDKTTTQYQKNTMFFRTAALLLLIQQQQENVAGFQQQPILLASSSRLVAQQQQQKQQQQKHALFSSSMPSDYDRDEFLDAPRSDINRANYYDGSNNSFRVAGEGVQGHQILTPRQGPRPPTPRGPHMSVTTAYPDGADSNSFRAAGYRSSDRMMLDGDNDNDFDYSYDGGGGGGGSLRVGGRPVEGHQVLRPRRRSSFERRMERGPHMDVTTSNPRFIPTDRRRRTAGGPYYEDDEEYGMMMPGERVYRGGAGVRPDTQDLQGVGRMPMQNEEWDRYRNTREDSTPFRATRSRDDDDDDFANGGGGTMPHFFSRDERNGMPVSTFERQMPRGRKDTLYDLDENRESEREREWRDIQNQEGRRGGRRGGGGFRPNRQDLQGLGRMPMRGADWDDTAYPERRGVPRRSQYPQDDLVDNGYFPRTDRSYGAPPPPPPRRGGARSDELFVEDDEYIREGPHMVRSGLPSYGRDRRGGGGGGVDDDLYDEEQDDRYYRRGRRTTRPPRRDRRGSVGGPMDEELFGVDSDYARSRQSWTTGTSMDTI